MERIYIRVYYLKILHYFFFSLSILSLTIGIMFFDFMSFDSLVFFGLSYAYCISSLAIAYYFYKDYKETMEALRIIRLIAFPYIVISVFTVGAVALMASIFPFITELIYSFMFVNFYVIFVLVIGLAMSRFRMVSRFFETYSYIIMRKAKRIAEKYALITDVQQYRIGTNPEADQLLDDIWANRDYPLPYVREFEIALCEEHVRRINRIIGNLKSKPGIEKHEENFMKSMELMKENYMDKIRKISTKKD